MRVLYVEDDKQLAALVSQYLSKNMIVDSVHTIEDAKSMISAYGYNFLLLDRDIEGKDVGLTLIEFIKSLRLEPYIIVMSAYGSLDDKVEGLELGANDYLEKPFHLKELLARMTALQRQSSGIRLEIQGLICDINEKRIFFDNEEIILTQKENNLLFYLIMNRQKIIDHKQLLDALYLHPEDITANTIHVTITHIRKKLPVDIIRTIKTRGYTINEK